jgi:hypothetical protein
MGTAKSLALHTQAFVQGAFIFAKAKGRPGDRWMRAMRIDTV